MRILMTGFTPLQLNSPLAGRVKKINVPRALTDVLRGQGHAVDWRLVEVGETIEDVYDLLIVNAAPSNSLNGRMGALGSLWSLSRPLPTIVHFDDWQFDCVFNSLTGLINHGDRYMFKRLPDGTFFFRGNAQDPELPFVKDRIYATARAFRQPWKRWLALCPMYAWGDKTIIRKRMKGYVARENFSFLDPTPLVIDRFDEAQRVMPTEKARRWALGSLMSPAYWLSRQRVAWPIDQFGTNKKDVREGRTTVLADEAAVRLEYARRWGVLSPEYPQAGSGWFRSRFVYAAQVGSVLYCGPRDGAQLGDAYRVPINRIEAMNDANLTVLAAEQHDLLSEHAWGEGRFVAELQVVIDRAFDLFARTT